MDVRFNLLFEIIATNSLKFVVLHDIFQENN